MRTNFQAVLIVRKRLIGHSLFQQGAAAPFLEGLHP
jgi:hypothetical protein